MAPVRQESPVLISTKRSISITANVTLCDTKGVIYRGRTEGMNQWKARTPSRPKPGRSRTLWKGADIFYGLSVKGALTPEMLKRMAKNPSFSPWPIPTRKSRLRKPWRFAPTLSWRPAAQIIPIR